MIPQSHRRMVVRYVGMAAVLASLSVAPVAGGTFPPNCSAIELISSNFQVDEDQLRGVITVERTIVTISDCSGRSEATVEVLASSGTATLGVDVSFPQNPTPLSFVFIFAHPARPEVEAGMVEQQSAAFSITDDLVVEGDEFIDITLQNVTGEAHLGPTAKAVLTILDNDAEVGAGIRFSSSKFRVQEGESQATIRVERPDANEVAASVQYSATAGSAKPGEDFTPVSGTLNWGAGQTGERTFTVPILDDNDREGDESVNLTLSQPTGDELGSPSTAQLIIEDNDQPSGISTTSGDNQVGQPGSVLPEPLTVEVTDRDDEPIAGARVSWTVVEGEAVLLNGRQTTTNSQGITANRVQLGNEPGQVVIEARITGTSQRVLFTINSALELRQLARNEAEAAVAGGLEQICSQPDPGGMRATCEALAALSPADKQKALDELSPKKIPTQGTAAVEAMTVQFGNIFSQLASLRKAKQRGLEFLAFDFGGQRLPVAVLADARAPGKQLGLDLDRIIDEEMSGGAASADQQEDTSQGESFDLDRRLGFFLSGLFATGDRPDAELETGFDFETAGATLGLDYLLSRSLAWGGAVGYMATDATLQGSGGSVDARGYSFWTYLLAFPDNGWFFEAIAGYGQGDFETLRAIDFPGNPQAATAKPAGDQWAGAMGLGYDVVAGGWTVSLVGRGSYISATIEAYEEEGAPGMQLAIDEQELESLLGTAGLEVSYAGSASWGVLMTQFRGAYQHEFEDSSRLISARFVDDPQGITFFVPTEDPDRDYFNLGLGMSAVFKHGHTIYIMYSQDLQRDDLNIGVLTGGFRFQIK